MFAPNICLVNVKTIPVHKISMALFILLHPSLHSYISLELLSPFDWPMNWLFMFTTGRWTGPQSLARQSSTWRSYCRRSMQYNHPLQPQLHCLHYPQASTLWLWRCPLYHLVWRKCYAQVHCLALLISNQGSVYVLSPLDEKWPNRTCCNTMSYSFG